MASPTSVPDYLDLVRKSGLVDERILDAHLQKVRASGTLPAQSAELARLLTRDGILTPFQARRLLEGKWRRFIIGKYKILDRLGAGGMGLVYLCEHRLMRRRVAIKILPASMSQNPSALERFYREARAVAALDHPNIVHAYDIDQDQDLHFLVMEFIDGANLQQLITRQGRLDILAAADYIRQAALGLQHAHEKVGLVHRDIKPDNLLVDRQGVVKVLDLGLARFLQGESDELSREHNERVVGTADYVAPEIVVDGLRVDIRADVYSLGATFYHCLTGQPPFGPGPAALKRIWHQVRQPKAVGVFRPEVPEEMARIAARMLAKDPSQRYQAPGEVADALAPWTQQPPPRPPLDGAASA